MFCANCGRPENSSDKFCQYCGAAYISNSDDGRPAVQGKIIVPVAESKPVKLKKSSAKKIIITVLIIALIFVGGGAYLLKNSAAFINSAAFSNGGLYNYGNETSIINIVNTLNSMLALLSKISGDRSPASTVNTTAQVKQAAHVNNATLAPDGEGQSAQFANTTSAPPGSVSTASKDKTSAEQINKKDNKQVKGYEYVKDMKYAIVTQSDTREGYYEGETLNGLPHGNGIFTNRDSSGNTWQYVGSFVEGRFEGEGVRKKDDGSGYEGSYKNNLPNGFGKLYIKNHILLFEGMYIDGIRQGKGKFFSNGEIVFEGEFVDNIPEEQLFKDSSKGVSYGNILRLPENYEHAPIMVTGKVLQVIELKDMQVDFRIATRDGRNDQMYIAYDRKEGEIRVLKNDEVCFWGICSGMVSYESNLGGIINVPGVMAFYVSVGQYDE